MAYFYISAAHKSSGKTTLSIGLSAALCRRGLTVQTFKKGPDYIDPLWLASASGRSSYNLDFFTMPEQEIEACFDRHMVDADIGLIEGNKGLYDGLDVQGSNSNAALAKLLDAPVVLVIDTRGTIRGVVPLLMGYQQFDPQVQIAGVIFNQVGGDRHERKLREVTEYYTDIPVLGAVHRDPRLSIDERHLGLMPSNEAPAARQVIEKLADAVEQQVELDLLIEMATMAPRRPQPDTLADDIVGKGDLRIGLLKDAAFGFYYASDLHMLRTGGAELIEIDALNDPRLPDIDGLIIGGGFPETQMQALEDNASLRQSIHDFIEQDGPVYAECGGLMYLCRSLTWQGKRCNMVGVIPADAVMYERPQGRGYIRLKERAECPWPKARQPAPEVLPGHEFHYSRLENFEGQPRYAFDVLRGSGIDGQHDGYLYRNLLASYAHLRDVGGVQWTSRFLDQVRACRAAGQTTSKR